MQLDGELSNDIRTFFCEVRVVASSIVELVSGGFGTGSRWAKMTHKKEKKVK
jgi:hypothetical protein